MTLKIRHDNCELTKTWIREIKIISHDNGRSLIIINDKKSKLSASDHLKSQTQIKFEIVDLKSFDRFLYQRIHIKHEIKVFESRSTEWNLKSDYRESQDGHGSGALECTLYLVTTCTITSPPPRVYGGSHLQKFKGSLLGQNWSSKSEIVHTEQRAAGLRGPQDSTRSHLIDYI